jgi:hypothetical protein
MDGEFIIASKHLRPVRPSLSLSLRKKVAVEFYSIILKIRDNTICQRNSGVLSRW